MKLHKGFTLIELLIVVAIIAILAAIAVPNFLEAQVRSKVARVMSDQRSFSTALESYIVDNRRGPVCGNEASVILGFSSAGFTNQSAQAFLTTPVAYMTGRLRDPFVDKGAKKNGTQNAYFLNYYTYRSYFQPDRWPATNAVPKAAARGYTWAIHSFGPAADSSKPDGTGQATLAAMLIPAGQGIGVYDPSNGTKSYGWIFRTNKGVGSGADFVGCY